MKPVANAEDPNPDAGILWPKKGKNLLKTKSSLVVSFLNQIFKYFFHRILYLMKDFKAQGEA